MFPFVVFSLDPAVANVPRCSSGTDAREQKGFISEPDSEGYEGISPGCCSRTSCGSTRNLEL